jgi:hypothetical protein
VPITIDLHIVATDVDDLKEQLKKALGSLQVAPPVAEPAPVAIASDFQKSDETAKEYRDNLSAKTAASMQNRKKNLKKFTGPIYGWDVDAENNLIPNWEEQDVISRIKKELESGTSARQIAGLLNSEKITTKMNKQFRSATVNRAVSNDLHARVNEFTRPEGATTAKPLECKACNGAHRAHTCERAQRKKAKTFKASEKSMKCNQCGTTKTSQWRLKTASIGPLCNACGIRHIRGKPKKEKVLDRSEQRKKERTARIQKNLRKNAKKATKAKLTPVEPKPQPVVVVDTSDEAFATWLQANLGLSILRSRHFLLASKLINTWYTSIQPQESLGAWLLNEGTSKMLKTADYFNKLQRAYPTIFIVEDTGDNFVLVVSDPKKLNTLLFTKMNWR